MLNFLPQIRQNYLCCIHEHEQLDGKHVRLRLPARAVAGHAVHGQRRRHHGNEKQSATDSRFPTCKDSIECFLPGRCLRHKHLVLTTYHLLPYYLLLTTLLPYYLTTLLLTTYYLLPYYLTTYYLPLTTLLLTTYHLPLTTLPLTTLLPYYLLPYYLLLTTYYLLPYYLLPYYLLPYYLPLTTLLLTTYYLQISRLKYCTTTFIFLFLHP